MKENIEIIGERKTDAKADLTHKLVFGCMIFFFLTGLCMLIDDLMYIVIGGIGLGCGILSVIYLLLMKFIHKRNNANPNPSFVLRKGELIVHKLNGRQKIYTDKLTQVNFDYKDGVRVVFFFQKPSGARYKVGARFIKNLGIVEDIRKKFSLPGPMQDHGNLTNPFEYDGKTFYTLGDRQVYSAKMIFFVCAITFFLLPALMIWMTIEFPDSAGIYLGIGFGVYVFVVGTMFFAFLPSMISDKTLYPPIGLREDGVVTIFHSNKKVEYLDGKITDVKYIKHVTVSSSSSSTTIGNTTYTTTTTTTTVHPYGRVVFTVVDSGGKTRKKIAKNVSYCEPTANRIKKILQK